MQTSDHAADFYPRPPRGGRRALGGQFAQPVVFLSTPSARRATDALTWQKMSTENFYPRPPRGGRLLHGLPKVHHHLISIHALREEGDPAAVAEVALRAISIHALREEGDSCWCPCKPSSSYFYPRPPRGGRRSWVLKAWCVWNFYPRPPRGGRRFASFGGDLIDQFLSTPSARRATSPRWFSEGDGCISIHALREEGDDFVKDLTPAECNFYPRPPRGGRHART